MKRFRLTPMQEAMLFEAQNAPGRYISKLRYALKTPADSETLSQRLTLLVRRHEALRTSVVRDNDGVLWQETGEKDAGHFSFSLTQPNELTVEFNHVLLDGWSVGIIMRELLAEKEPEVKAYPFRYYLKWLERRALADDLNWWKEYLDGMSQCRELPNALKSTDYERRELRFSIDDSELLRQRARELKITAGRLLQAVWCMLTARYNGGESIVPCIISGRSAPVPGITEMVGMCVNTLPIATKLPGESGSFADWAARWSRQTAEAEKHGFCNLGDLISGTLPHVLAIDPSFDGEGFSLKSSSAVLVTDFDAAFTLGSEIKAEFAYNACVYTDEAVKAIQGHFLTALHAILKNPRIPLTDIPILTSEEISELTAINEDTEILSIIERQTIIDFWRESANAHASRTALVCGDVSLTYAELSETVNRLSSALIRKGVGAEIPAAILLPRSEKYVIAELAVLSAGGFFIPLDTEWPKQRVRVILDENKPFIVIDEASYTQLLTDCETPPPAQSPKPHNAAYMIMTSGTTGVPKGVVVTHRNIANFCLWAKQRYGWKPGDACAMVLGFSFDGSMWDIWLPLISGGTLHILKDDVRFNLSALGDYCKSKQITHIDLPVTMADSFREIYRGENAPAALRVMVTGGEEVRRIVSAPYPLSNEYGPTECTVCCSVGWLYCDTPVTTGAPPPNMNAYVLDEHGRLCPDGVTGEAHFSGVQVARGHYNAPELTAERFIENPFAGGDANHDIMYRTGDLMKWIKRGGRRELVFMGRADNQVKISGFRIELSEIEAVLRSHSAVSAVTAVVAETAAGEKRIYAYVVPQADALVSDLDKLLDAKLPSFMRPAIVMVDAIPLNGSGKVDAGRLPRPKALSEVSCIPPANENEKALIAAVSKTLGVKNIGTNHNYHELGGNSINAMRITFCLEREGYVLSAKDLITSVSLGAAAVKMRSTTPVAKAEYKANTFTPLAAQRAMVFLTETESPDMYAVTLTQSAADLTVSDLKRRLDKATKLHDILRTTFERGGDGQVIGRVHSAADLPRPVVECVLRDGELTIRYHHIALDGHSVGLLTRELLYGEFPENAASFAQFANRLSADKERQGLDEAWWRTSCKSAEIVPLIPRNSGMKAEYKRTTFCSAEFFNKCVDIARKTHVTPAAFALTAWGIVVSTLGGVDGDILVPFVASCRDDDTLMGMCAETRPLVFAASGEPFGDLARRVQDSMLESIAHWFVPQEIIGKLPRYLFVFEDGADGFTANGRQNYDLVVKLSKVGELIYNAACLPEAGAREIALRLNAALTAALDDRVSVFLEDEFERVTKTFAQGRVLKVTHSTAAEAFTAAAVAYANRVALETGSETLTYAELFERARRLADELNTLGIGVGNIAAFNLPRNAEAIIAQLGIALSGAAFLPLDPAWPEGRINDILRDSGASVCLRNGLAIEITGAKSDIQSDTAYIIYTSGTTGKPKGVLVPQAALANQIAWAIDEFGFTPNDKMLHYIAFTFDPSVWVLFTTLSSGAALSLLPEDIRLDPDACVRHIAENQITRCTLPAAVGPDILRRVTDAHLRTAFLGGEAIKNLSARDYEIVNCYGPTEACINAAFRRLSPDETETRNIGKPVANTNCYVLDIRGQACPVGVQGELCISGIQLAHGYLGRPMESASAFAEHPRFGRIYKTGDRAAWNGDGTLTFFGRADSQVKIRGHRVELSEIENVLREMPGVSDAKVFCRDGALDAYIIGASDTADLKKRLPSYMLPRSVTVMDSFPLTANSKVDFGAFPAPSAAATESAEPLTEAERAVAAAWKTALGLDAGFTIGRGDNFYDLGGHSLLLFHIVGLLAAGGIDADIRTLVGHPVLADLADAIGRKNHSVSHRAASAAKTSDKSYSLYVRRMEGIDLSETRPFRNVLITGATGFLGSHLVRDFFLNTGAEIHLPVRGDTLKLKDALVYYFRDVGAKIAASKRIHIYPADISEKPPDINAALDAIFHAAADIRHYAPEPEMYRANVTATENMLTLAAGYPDALFAHISTTSAVNSPVIHENDAGLGPEFENIYQRTKQLAERLVMDAGRRGLEQMIFRVGHVSPGYENGSVARNWEINAMLRLINAMLITGLLPEQDYSIGYGYVDKTARAIRLLSSPISLDGLIFHIDNPNTLRLSELFKLAGLRGQVVPRNELTARLRTLCESENTATAQAALEYLGRLSQGSLEKDSPDIVAGKIKMDATLLLLERLGFRWPYVTEEYMKNVISSLKVKGGTGYEQRNR